MRRALWYVWLSTLFRIGAATMLVILMVETHKWWIILLLLGFFVRDIILGEMVFSVLLAVFVSRPAGILYALGTVTNIPATMEVRRLKNRPEFGGTGDPI